MIVIFPMLFLNGPTLLKLARWMRSLRFVSISMSIFTIPIILYQKQQMIFNTSCHISYNTNNHMTNNTI